MSDSVPSYDFPQKIRGEASMRREWIRLRRAISRAGQQKDARAMAYLVGRMERLRTATGGDQ